MFAHRIYQVGSGFWVVESLPYRGEDTVDVFPSYDHGMLECSKRDLAIVRANGTAGERMTWNGKPAATYERYHLDEIQRLEKALGLAAST